MKERLDQYILIGLGIIVSGIVVYAFVHARHVCCSPVKTSVLMVDKKFSPDVSSHLGATFAPRGQNDQRRSNNGRIKHRPGCGAGNACCGTGQCAGFKQAAYVGSSTILSVYPVHKDEILFMAPDSLQTALKPVDLVKPLPLYILTQTLLC